LGVGSSIRVRDRCRRLVADGVASMIIYCDKNL
jgi:hypothetical protein